MAKPGNEYSVIDFIFDDDTEIPNYMIIPIRPDESAKVGDIVLTWWQSGSGMKRAIVTNASDPTAPEVNYIDIEWDNPAKLMMLVLVKRLKKLNLTHSMS